MFSKLIGIPYKLGGRTAEGMDCIALVLKGLELLGAPTACPWSAVRQLCVTHELPDSGHYPHGWRALEAGEPTQRGDILLTQRPGEMAHVALAIGGSLVLTTAKGTGSIVCRISRLPTPIALRFRTPQLEGAA